MIDSISTDFLSLFIVFLSLFAGFFLFINLKVQSYLIDDCGISSFQGGVLFTLIEWRGIVLRKIRGYKSFKVSDIYEKRQELSSFFRQSQGPDVKKLVAALKAQMLYMEQHSDIYPKSQQHVLRFLAQHFYEIAWSYVKPEINPVKSKQSSWKKILGLPEDTLLEWNTVKKAYRKLAQTHHPDKGGDHDTFIRIKQAYEQAEKAFITK